MKSLIPHKAGNRWFTDLLSDYDYVPIVKFVRNVFDRIFLGFIALHEGSHILKQLNIDGCQRVH